MQTIMVRAYAAAGNSDAKLKATCLQGVHTVGIDHTLDMDSNFARAARGLAVKLRWEGEYVGGELPNGDRVYVRMDAHNLRQHERFQVQQSDFDTQK